MAATLLGCGSAIPSRVVSNGDLASLETIRTYLYWKDNSGLVQF